MLTCPRRDVLEHLPRRRARPNRGVVLAALGIGIGLNIALGFGPARIDADDTARAGVTNLRLAVSGDVDSSTVFPARIAEIDALFEYVDAENEEIELVIKGRGGIETFRHVALYDGSGSARVPIRGAAMYPVIVETLSAAAREAKRNAKSASTRSFGVKEYLLSAQAGVIRTGYAAETLLAADLPRHVTSRAEVVLDVVAASLESLEAAIALPEADVEEIHRIAASVDVGLGDAVLASSDLQAAAASISRMAIPSTGDEILLLQALISGTVAATTEFGIEAVPEIESLYLPLVASN